MMTFHKIAAAVLLVLTLAGITGAGFGTAKLLADQNGPTPAPPTGATTVMPDAPPISSATLSNGVSFEVLGLSENPSAGKQWWLANGDLLTTPPYARMRAKSWPNPGSIPREIAVSINDSVNGSTDPATMAWSVVGEQGASSATAEDRNGKPISGVTAEAVEIPDSPAGVTIRANIAAGRWQTIFTAEGMGQMSEGTPQGSVVFSRVFTIDRRSHIVLAYSGPISNEQDLRLVAIDTSGNVVPANVFTTGGSQNSFVGEYSVALRPSAIRQWELQTRKFDQWIEIRGVSLHAGQKTNVTVATSDDQKNP
jgi:hypothetical protein